MKDNVMTIFSREIRNYFNTPIGYVFLTVALFINFLFFFIGIFDIVPAFWDTRVASVRGYMNMLPLTFILLVPAVSMRIWSEEFKSGTIELLYTLPFTQLELVLGKLLAAWAFVSVPVFAAIPLTLHVWSIGNLDLGTTFALYTGSLLMAGAYVSLGMVISALTREQIVAFILIFTVSIAMFLMNYYILSQHLGPVAARIGGFFSLSYHFSTFSRGMISLADTVYYISFISLMVFLNIKILRSER